MDSNDVFRKELGKLFSEITTALNEIADVCTDDALKERFFMLKRCFERGTAICQPGPRQALGEEAPEFASEKGSKPRIVDL
ncbi:MAG: hypothetical protein E3J72_18605 [Planctomycetota bacterium]|nr:MAG: hypothetical protein E3J72_18605 [Planctomycetota bacterium]